MVSRITSSCINSAIMKNMQKSYTNYSKLTEQISSGKKINSIADSKQAINIISANREINKMDNWNNNIDFMTNTIKQTSDSIEFITDKTQRMKDLASFAANQSGGERNLEATFNEIDEIIKGIVSVANTKYNNSYIFSGSNIDTQTYSIEYDDNGEIKRIMYNGTPKNTDWQRKLEIGEGEFQHYNITGIEIFGEASEQNRTGLMGDLITFREELKSAMENGGNYENLQSMVDKFSDSIDRMSMTNSRFGSTVNKLEQQKEMYSSSQLNLKEYISGIQDIDYTEAVGEWYNAQSSFEASMKVFTEFNSVSLLNYI